MASNPSSVLDSTSLLRGKSGDRSLGSLRFPDFSSSSSSSYCDRHGAWFGLGWFALLSMDYGSGSGSGQGQGQGQGYMYLTISTYLGTFGVEGIK